MSLPRLIGVIHLPPLTGSPRADEDHPADLLQAAGLHAVREALIFAQAGFDAIILQNHGDAPFYLAPVPPETVASMAIIAAAVRESVRLQIGIHVLKNDARAALAIAAVTGCDFIRVPEICLREGGMAALMRERSRLNAEVAVLVDLDSKLTRSPLWAESMIEGVLISGDGSFEGIEMDTLESLSRAARENKISLYLESPASHDQLSEWKPWIDGMIVGPELRKGGQAGAPLDAKKVKEFSQFYAKLGRSKKGRPGKGKTSRK